jgi:hypothetical protein
MIAGSTGEHPEPEHKEPERIGVIDFMVVILFPGLVPDEEFVADPPCIWTRRQGRNEGTPSRPWPKPWKPAAPTRANASPASSLPSARIYWKHRMNHAQDR